MNKQEVLHFIEVNPVFALATCLNNIPHVRNMALIKADESGIIFNVKKYKPVYQQLIANPNIELCFYNKDSGTQIRISGKATEFYDNNIVEEILLKHPDLQNQILKYGRDVIALFVIKAWSAKYWNSSNKEQSLEIK